MSIFEAPEAPIADAVGRLIVGNPFLPERIELEQTILRDQFVPGQMVWSVDPALPGENPNIIAIGKLAERLADTARQRAVEAGMLSPEDRVLYERLALYVLYYRYEDPLYLQITQPETAPRETRFDALYDRFVRDYRWFFEIADRSILPESPPELFALFFQHRRAIQYTFRHIYGSSLPAAELRAAVWQSIFTHDIERYRSGLINRMHELTTLITGPSGTGKELVAQAIGLSRHIPFDENAKQFRDDFCAAYLPLNLCALSPTLIESELFGHKKGSFTGAATDRRGFLEQPNPWATVFLDEFGEIDSGIQLKLLRVLQTREFQRLGDNTTRRFAGKIVAATNVDLAEEIQAGRFRADLYYRLCSDVIAMPSLREQLRDSPEELDNLVTLIALRLVDETHAAGLAREAMEWFDNHLGRGYPWPGNMRELEQGVRNILIRKSYQPPQALVEPTVSGGPLGRLVEQLRRGSLTADQLQARYYALIYWLEGSYEGSARRLGLDRRTVKSKMDRAFLADLRAAEER